MRSEERVCHKNGYLKRNLLDVENVLPAEEFNLFSDINPQMDSQLGNFFVEQADKMLEEDLTVLPLSLYMDLFKTGVRSRFERYHHRRRDIIFYLTLAEAYERKGRFVEKAADYIWAVLEETCWVIPAHYYHSINNPGTQIPENYREEDVPGLDLYAANCCATLACAKYFLKDQLDAISPVICKRIDHQIYLRGIRPFITATFGWASNVSNWLANIVNNILFATAITAQDITVRRRVMERAMYLLDNFSAYYPPDGCCDEGPGYWGAAPGNFFDCLELLEVMSGGKINVYHEPIIRNMGEYIVNFNIDKLYYLNFADAHPKIEHDGKRIMRYGKKCSSPALYSFGEMLVADNLCEKYYFFGHCYTVIKGLMSPRIEGEKSVIANKSVWYDSRKVAIFRESEKTNQGIFVATKGGTNAETHNHNDVGCLVVFKNGNPVIVDPSIGSYNHGFFGAERYGRWYMKSSYHSVPIVDGKEELNGAQYASSGECCDLENQTVSMELKGAFPKDAGIEKMVRSVSQKDGVVTVTDDVALDHKGDIRFNFLTLDEPKEICAGKLMLVEGVEFTYDTSLTLTLEKVENTWLPYEDINLKSLWGRENLWRIVLSANAEKCKSVVTFK